MAGEGRLEEIEGIQLRLSLAEFHKRQMRRYYKKKKKVLASYKYCGRAFVGLGDHARVRIPSNDVPSRVSLFWPLSPKLTRVSAKESRAMADLPFGYSPNMCHGIHPLPLPVTSSNDTSARRNGGYFKIFLTIEAKCAAAVIHGSAFSDDNSATVSSIPSLALGLVQLKGKFADGTSWSGFESTIRQQRFWQRSGWRGGEVAASGASPKDWLGLRVNAHRADQTHPVR